MTSFIRPLILIASLVVSACIPAFADTVTLVNPGFETGDFTGYTLGGNTDYTGVSGSFGGVAPHSGNFQAYFGAVDTPGTISQSFTDTPGNIYRLNYFLFNFGGTESFFSASVNGVPLYSLVNPPSFPYTQKTSTFVGTGSDTFTFTLEQDPSYFLLDDISVDFVPSAVPEPSSLVLLGTGVAGLVGVLRRRLVKT